MSLWGSTYLFPSSNRAGNYAEFMNFVAFGDFIPDAEGYPHIFSDNCLSQANYHKKFINQYGIEWWLKCFKDMPSIRFNA